MSMSISDARKRDRTLYQQAEDELFSIRQEKALLKERYDQALLDAKAVGMSNLKISEVLGVSEGAIRMYIKRKDLR